MSKNTREEYQTKTIIKSSSIYDKYLNAEIKPKKNSYRGKIYVLINGRSASASVVCAQVLKEYRNALIIGQEAGSNPYIMNGGSFRKLKLPNTKIEVEIPLSKIYIKSRDEFHGNGMKPDIWFKEEIGKDLPFDHMFDFVVGHVIKFGIKD